MNQEKPDRVLLVVERDPRFVERFKKHLALKGFRVFFVETSTDALFLMDSMPVSFLLLNLNGVLNWDDLKKLLRYVTENRLPLLIIEGLKRTQPLVDRLREKGYGNFIRLPFTISELNRKMATMVRPKDSMIGLQLGPEGQKVEILEKIGSGAMGKVFKAYQPSLDRFVAVKMMSVKQDGNASESAARFYNEAKAIAQLRSTHIVQVYFVGRHLGQPYFVMEYVDGPNLEKYIRAKGKLAPYEALKLFREILTGLMVAHHRGKVHRDMKPANVMLNSEGQAVILDFGLVRGDKNQNLTQEGMVLGTPRYIAPEQVKHGTVDHRSDLYALGVMLFEMIAGVPPFLGQDFVSVLMKHVQEPMPDLRNYSDQVDDSLYQLHQKLTAKDPAARYQSAEDVIADLDSFSDRSNTKQMRVNSTSSIAGVQPLGGLAINQRGDLVRQFGNMPEDRSEMLHFLGSVVTQIQDLEPLGSFQRGLVSLPSSKMVVFSCNSELAAIESDSADVSAKFNMMNCEALAKFFEGAPKL